MFNKIDHIGIAVTSIEESLTLYRDLFGFELISEEVVESQGVRVAFLSAGETKIELLEATREDSAVAKFISARGPGLHHLAFGCESIDDARRRALENDLRLLSDEPLVGAGGKLISFVHPKDTGGALIEFTQPQKS